MCLITEQKKAIRTKEDMIVWKNVKDCSEGVVSLYYDFIWEEGRLYATKMAKSTSIRSYDWDTKIAYGIVDVPNRLLGVEIAAKGLIAIGQGFHAFTEESRADKNDLIRQFLIPAGSLIYKDKTGLIVSNQIMMLPK